MTTAFSLPPWGLWILAPVGLAVLYRLLEGRGAPLRALVGFTFGIGLLAIGLYFTTAFNAGGWAVLVLFESAFVAAAFGWLSWRVIEQDRALDRQRAMERRDDEGARAVNSLQRTLLEILDQVAAEKPFPGTDSVLAVISPAGVTIVPPGRLP